MMIANKGSNVEIADKTDLKNAHSLGSILNY